MTAPTAGVRTVLRMRTREGCEAEFEAAWRRAAAEISRVPGNLRQELIRDADDPRTFLITSDWTDRAAVDEFGRSSARETLTEALRDLREDAARNTYEVLATVPGEQGPGEGTACRRRRRTVAGRLCGPSCGCAHGRAARRSSRPRGAGPPRRSAGCPATCGRS